MLGWAIAAAGLWRGLTADELAAVEAEVTKQLTAAAITDPTTMTGAAALAILAPAIETVLVKSRG